MGALALPQPQPPAASRPISILTGSGKFRTNHARVKPISRAAPITGSVSRSVDSWRPHSQTTSDDTRNPRTTTAMFVMRRQRDE